jgi:hypothetical protein
MQYAFENNHSTNKFPILINIYGITLRKEAFTQTRCTNKIMKHIVVTAYICTHISCMTLTSFEGLALEMWQTR